MRQPAWIAEDPCRPFRADKRRLNRYGLRPAAAGVAKLAARDSQTQSSDAFILNAGAHCLALQMIFFSSPPQGSDDFLQGFKKAISHTAQLWQPCKL